MIQMLENVNEINITLKITQMRLQKENRDKNVIIHHLKAASSQSSGKQISLDLFRCSSSVLNEY